MGNLETAYVNLKGSLQVTYRHLWRILIGQWSPPQPKADLIGHLMGTLWAALENSDCPMVPTTANYITDITTSFT